MSNELTIEDYEVVLSEHRRLVRQLDVLLNGAGAAQQATLCDIVSQLEAMQRRRPKVLAECATSIDGIPTAWVAQCPFCQNVLHINVKDNDLPAPWRNVGPGT